MANLSIYLFWTGMVTSLIASGLYVAYVTSASLAVRKMSAQTTAGTVTIAQASGVPNAGLGRLATTFASFTVLFLGAQVVVAYPALDDGQAMMALPSLRPSGKPSMCA